MERRDHGAEPQSGQLLRTRGFGLRPFSFTGGAMGARHAYWSRIAERRGEKEENKLALRKKLLRKSSRTNRVGRLLCSSPCSSLSCGFSVGRHPRPVPGLSPGRPRCAPSSLPAPRPAAPTASLGASLTLPTPHKVPHSRLARRAMESDHPSTNAWCWRDGAGPDCPL